MSTPKNLKDLFTHTLKDLWSANDQMKDVVKDMADAASDDTLTQRLEKSTNGIQQHTDMLKTLLEDIDAEADKEHCKGMEGLVKEARKHALADDLDNDVRDVAIIEQYQRMCHYGITGFGTAAAYARALDYADLSDQLEEAVENIYESDEYMSDLAERSKNLAAKA